MFDSPLKYSGSFPIIDKVFSSLGRFVEIELGSGYGLSSPSPELNSEVLLGADALSFPFGSRSGFPPRVDETWVKRGRLVAAESAVVVVIGSSGCSIVCPSVSLTVES